MQVRFKGTRGGYYNRNYNGDIALDFIQLTTISGWCFNSDVFQVVSRKVRRATHFGFYLRWNLDTGDWKEEWDLA